MSLAAGALSAISVGLTTSIIESAEATGGTEPYTYQWYRDTEADFTPGVGNILTGETNLTLSDSGLTPETYYYYKMVVIDDDSTEATSTELEIYTQMGTTKTDTYVYQDSGSAFQGNAGKAPMGTIRGRMRVVKFEGTFAADVQAIADKIKLFKIQPGWRVLDWKVYCPSLGTTGIFKMGYAASTSGNTVADDDAFGSGYDAGGQLVLAVPAPASAAGWLKLFDEEVEVEAVFTEASDSANGDIIKGWFMIAVD